jgi:hypothetical protein
MSALDKRVKTALDETRLFILGAQILFGFHLNGAFQNGFDELNAGARALHAAAFFLMTVAIGALIAPSLEHQLVEQGQASKRMLAAATSFASIALFPFALSLGIDLFIVFDHRFGRAAGAFAGVGLFFLALALWYGPKWTLAPTTAEHTSESSMEETPTPLDVRIEQMLTEARVMLPGAQALLGFQLAILLTQAFESLPMSSKVVHAVALSCIALAVILLVTPASIHRVAYGGENSETFYRIGSRFVVAAALPLAIGIAGDLYVAVAKAVDSPTVGAATAFAAAILLAGLWLVYPYRLRQKLNGAGRHQGAERLSWNRKSIEPLGR